MKRDAWLDIELDAMSVYRHDFRDPWPYDERAAVPIEVDEDADTVPIKLSGAPMEEIPKEADTVRAFRTSYYMLPAIKERPFHE